MEFMSEWAEKVISHRKAELEKQELQDRALVEKQRIKREFAPVVWRNLRNAFQLRCEELNRANGSKLVELAEKNPREFSVRIVGQGVELAVVHQNETIQYSYGSVSGAYSFSVGKDGSLELVDASRYSFTADYIAQEVLGELLRRVG